MDSRQQKIEHRQSTQKLDQLAPGILGGVTVAISHYFDNELAVFTFIAALVFHYLSLEAEANVFHPWFRRKKYATKLNQFVNFLTIAFNFLRLVAFLIGFGFLLNAVV